MKLKHVVKIFLSATRLHNFCINENELSNEEEEGSSSSSEDFVNDYVRVLQYIPSDIEISQIQGSSMIRDIIVEQIAGAGLRRPVYNLQRNQDHAA